MMKSLVFLSIFLVSITAALSPCDTPPWVVGEYAKSLQVECEKIVQAQEQGLKKFLDFINSLPLIKQTIDLKEQFKNTSEYRILIDLLDGTDFKNFVQKVKESEEYNRLVEHLNRIQNQTNDIIDYDNALIKSLIINIRDLLPIDEVQSYYVQISNSPEYQSVKDLLDGTDFGIFIGKVKDSKQYEQFVELIRGIEGKVNAIFDYDEALIKRLFVYATYLNPTDKIEELYVKIKDSAGFRIIADLVDGTDFRNFVAKVKSSEQYHQVAVFVQNVEDRLAEIVDDEEALIKKWIIYISYVLPIDEIQAYYAQILNSPEYQSLKDLLDGTDFKVLVYKIKSTRQYQQFAAYLQGLRSFYGRQYNGLVDGTKGAISTSLNGLQN